MKKKIVVCMCLIGVLVFVTGCSTEKELSDTTDVEQEVVEEESKDVLKENEFVKDDVVNKFIKDYNGISPYPISNISQGNIKTKFFGYSNNCYLEMINSTSSFNLSINGGNDSKDIDKILEVYKYSIKVFDETISDDQINKSIDDFKNSKYMIEDYSLTENITILYKPVIEVSYGKTDCRIDIQVVDYQ